jgi:hypothetical protein
MASTRDTLRSSIDLLTESEAREVAALTQTLYKRRGVSPTLARLAADPLFAVPSPVPPRFAERVAAKGSGAPASQLLVQDRR